MIVCRSCGGHNEDAADFCGSCGEFLEWTGEKLAPKSAQPPAGEPQPPAGEPEPAAGEPEPAAGEPQPATPQPKPTEPKPVAAGFTPAVAGATPTVPGSTPAATAFTPAVGGFTPAVGGSTPTVTPPRPAAPSFKPAITAPAQRAADALVAPVRPDPDPPVRPVPTPGPAARKPQPQEMRPQAPVRRRPTAPPVPSPPTRQPQPDDLICGMCGEGNPPTRRFCSRCGDSLQTATVVPAPPLPWWRRILQRFDRKVHPAGARPKQRSGVLTARGLGAALRRILLVAALLAGLLYAAVPSMRSVVHGLVRDGKDRVDALFGRKDVEVRPISTTATAALDGHSADQATDLGTNTFWAAPDAAARPTLVVVFDHPTQLSRAIVHNGDGAGDFPALGRPHELHLVYFDGSGTVLGATDVILNDTPNKQEVQLSGGDGATRVELQVMSAHRSPSNPGLALSEIEFFERQ